MEIFRQKIAELLLEETGLDLEDIKENVEVPPDRNLGDFAFPCFKLAKIKKKNPAQIASEIVENIEAGEYFSAIEATGPYINFTCNLEKLNQDTLERIYTQGRGYGKSSEGDGKTVVIDFSSPNIAKPFGFGHLRSTVIGNSLANVYETLGYNVERINHLGDWGTQFGNLIAAYLKWGNEQELEKDPIEYLYDLYVKFHEEMEEDPSLKDEGREWFRKLEEGDETAEKLWEWFREMSLKDFERIYRKLGVKFDSNKGEAFYNDKLEDTIETIKDSGIATYSQGALIVDLNEENLPPCLLKKQDGATLYITRDLTAAFYRYENYQFDKALYVVGADQELHFNQMFNVLKKMGCDWAENMEHVPFGLIRFQDRKMSTRKGNMVYLEDVLEKAKQLALETIREKNPELDNQEDIAEMVGVGAVIFGDLSNDRVKEVNFDWDKILDFNGETAPYLQYTHARICSVLKKADITPEYDKDIVKHLQSDYEKNVIQLLAGFTDALKRTRDANKPHILARYLLDLGREFNRFYNHCPILNETEEVKQARLILIDAVRQVLANGLGIMGIKAPEAM
ncbi:arginine--tRNA ligase [Natranaerobius thermophilus]|uniref:Arginine--tRNA ligase n=1 Tax=Natranaerobius thermophilus (strain ATCC BAA-1301 / DSM 18059 / JW/NM-WN-LF) TaxID=457570 RepID=B2A229_NATTJ|nr:arginine--tRNA ligase [Natranaerobius thermophilus]ACB84834.1 arginyl-tRNA synthetase [Natranaerobius thermophilus JW/NM-WN-LF]